MIAAAAATWGAIPLFVRAVDASPLVIVFWRVAFGAAAAGFMLALRGRWAEFASLSWRRRGAIAVQGVLLALNWVLFFTGLRLAPVATAELLAYCGPVLVAALGPLMIRERFDRRILIPLALALGGTFVILSPAGASLPRTALLGAAAALASALTYAVLVLNAKRLLVGVSSEVYLTTEWLVASAVLLPAVLMLPGPTAVSEWGALLALGVVETALTGFLFVAGLRVVRADRAATLTYLEPVAAVLFAAVWLGEPLTAAIVIGGVAVVVAGALVARLAPVPASEEAPLA